MVSFEWTFALTAILSLDGGGRVDMSMAKLKV
jgi:hypothetical protein